MEKRLVRAEREPLPRRREPGIIAGAMQQPAGQGVAQRCTTLGNVCLALGLLELLYCGQKVIFQLLSGRMLAGEKVLLPSGPHGPPPQMYAEAEALTRQLVPWEIARMVPFAVASVVLLFIARRLRAGDASALGAARQWAIAALGVDGVSVLVQVVATVPATLAYQARIAEMMPKVPPSSHAPPFDVGQVVSSMTVVGTIMGVAMGAAAMAAWPVALYLWAGQLRLQARQGQGSTGEP